MGIQGLACVMCRGAIGSSGVSCAACGATYHADCYQGVCESCACAKEPRPFSLAGQSRWLPARSVVLAALAIGIVGAWWASFNRLVLRPPPGVRPFLAVLPRALPASRPTLRNVLLPAPASAAITPAAAPVLAGRRVVRLERALSDGGPTVEIELGAVASRGFVVLADVQTPPDAEGLTELHADARSADGRWVPLDALRLAPATGGWFRVRAPAPFHGLRLSVAGPRARVEVSALVALDDAAPGAVAEAALPVRLSLGSDGSARLVAVDGANAAIPLDLVWTIPVADSIAVALPSANGLILADPNGLPGRWVAHGPAGGPTVALRPDASVRDGYVTTKLGDAVVSWIDGAGTWAALERRGAPPAVTWRHARSIEVVAVIFADGSVRLTRAPGGRRTGAPLDLADPQELFELVQACERGDPFFAMEIPYRVRLNAQRLKELVGSQSAAAELVRFLRTDVLAALGSVSPGRPPPADGDPLILGWRPSGFSQELPRGLRITRMESDHVLVRGENAFGALAGDELALPRGLLPGTPAPQVGATLIVYRALPSY